MKSLLVWTCCIIAASGTSLAFAPLNSSPRHDQRIANPAIWRRAPGVQKTSSLSSVFYQDADDQEYHEIVMSSSYDSTSSSGDEEVVRSINKVLKASSKSFENVETATNQLLNRHPLIALSIFVGAGVVVAYLTGMFFLGGYIETWNPVENDAIPYWDDPVLVIERKVGR